MINFVLNLLKLSKSLHFL